MTEPEFFTDATRWTQLTFTEDDPLTIDLDQWSAIMRDTKSNGALISAGGYIAYYPTKVPYHYRSKHLGEGDLFGDVVDRARSLGLRVAARVDPHAVHADAAEAHPEWIARTRDGEPMPHWSMTSVWLTCAFSSYHREVVTEIAREITREYDVDAIFANRWEGHGGMSYSEAAQRDFRDDTGLDLLKVVDATSPGWAEFTTWRRRQLTELVIHWNDAVNTERRGTRFIPNRGALVTRDLDPSLDQYYPAVFVDKQGRDTTEAPWAAGRVGKRSRGMYPDKPVNLITSVGPEHHIHRWKDSVDAPAELVTWIADGFVHGANPMFTKFSASIYDARWIEPMVTVFSMHARVEEVYAATTPTAPVAILDALVPDPGDPYGAYRAVSLSENGFYQAMVEARVPFEFLAADYLTADRLAAFDAIILPDARNLNADVCNLLRDYVRTGGNLLADHRSSLGSGATRPGSDLALADVFGVRLTGTLQNSVRNNYVAIATDHPVTAGYGTATRFIGGTEIVSVELLKGAQALLRFVPDHPDLPMEEVYPRAEPTAPALICNTYGRGTVLYAAFDLGAVYWENLLVDHQRLITNAVQHLLAGKMRATVTGHGMVDIAVRSSAERTVVSLVNLNSPFMMRGQSRGVDPLGPQDLVLPAPAGTGGARLRELIGGRGWTAEVEDDALNVHLDSVDSVAVVEALWTPA